MIYCLRQVGRCTKVRYFCFRPRPEDRDEKAVIVVPDIRNTTQADGPGRKPGRGVWLAAAVCLIAAALVCAALFRQGPAVSPDPGGVSGGGSSGSGAAAPDVTPPRLLGVRDLTVALNGTASYRDGVSAEDDVDGPVAVRIDADAVDLTVPGEYPVIYSAQDAAGNRTEQTVTITVVETATVDQGRDEPTEHDPSDAPGGGIPLEQVTQEEVDRLADEILGRITDSGMSQWEQARAIFNYVNGHVKYVGSSDKSSWLIGAYVGFTRGRGDCYNYFACSKALLTRAGISNVDLERVGGNSRHYWQLVNTGDGWYHFDACPHPNGYPLYSFMITEAQVRAYTEQAGGVRKNYYVYDYASCPVTVEGMPEELPEQPPAEGEDPGQQPPEGVPGEEGQLPGGGDPESSQDPGLQDPVTGLRPGEGIPSVGGPDSMAPPPDQSLAGGNPADGRIPTVPDQSREGGA